MKTKILILLIVLLVALLAAWPTVSAPSLTNFTDHVHIRAVGGTATPALLVDQRGSGVVAEFQDSGTPTARLLNGGGLRVLGGAFILNQQSETVTATFVITPTSPYIVMTSDTSYTSSTTTPIITTTATAGQVLILRNGNASDALVIDGTGGTVECKANVSLGASDTLTLIFNGSAWNCVAGYDNS